jgi:hypothetical protein
MKFRAEHEFQGISLADYEKLYFDEEFNEALCRAVNLDRTLQNREEKGGVLERAVKVGPDREVPKPVAKVIGADRIEYTEHLKYGWGSYQGTWYTVSSIMSDKVDSRGTFGFEELPDGVLRWIEGEIKVKIFGVGKVVEKFIVSDIERSYANAAAFTQKWIDSGGTT